MKHILLLGLLIPFFCFSQEGAITGKVIDEDFNEGLPFASIYVKGTQKGTSSDFEGRYTL